MTDDREEIIARYADGELTLEEAVNRVEIDRQSFWVFSVAAISKSDPIQLRETKTR